MYIIYNKNNKDTNAYKEIKKINKMLNIKYVKYDLLLKDRK